MFGSVISTIGKYIWQENSSLVQLPGGEFYVWKQKMGHAVRECLFKSSDITIQKRTEPHQKHWMVVRRIFEEGEKELEQEQGDVVEEQYVFEIKSSMEFERIVADEGKMGFKWTGVPREGQFNGTYEFVIDKLVTATTSQLFHLTMAHCIYEDYSGLEFGEASQAELNRIMNNQMDKIGAGSIKEMYQGQNKVFYEYDPGSNTFALKDSNCVVQIASEREFEFQVRIVGENETLYSHPIVPSATNHVDRKRMSFIWCKEECMGVWTFSLRFENEDELFRFFNVYSRCSYEILNRETMMEMKTEDIRYLTNPLVVEEMEDSEQEESQDEESTVHENQEKNQILAVGCRNERSFVSRGNSIGVFRHGDGNQLEFLTRIKVSDNPDKVFSPSKMMLYDRDTSLVLKDPSRQEMLYRMDLERGEIVEKWKVDDHVQVEDIVPSFKYASMTGSETLVGIGHNSIFQIDPRQPGTKKVVDSGKQYTIKSRFTCGATTGKGELAVGNQKGELRMFNRLDKKAKTLLPGLGDPIIGIDVSENGKYILATCKTYILLVETTVGDDTGFNRCMGDQKPTPIKLQLKPEHQASIGKTANFTKAQFSTGPKEEKMIIASTGPYVVVWKMEHVRKGRVYDYAVKKYSDNVVAENFRYGHDNRIIVTLPDQVTMESKKALVTPRKRQSFNSIVDSPF